MVRNSVITSFVFFLTCAHVTATHGATNGATYEVSFDGTWSRDTHPENYPAGAHFSPLIGATHNANVEFWSIGGLATNGIEVMAETGGTGPLSSEIRSASQNGTVLDTLRGSGISATGSTRFTFDIERSHPLVSLVTMIAPSPDWFLGVNGLELLQDGKWVDSVTIDLLAYDSGTDSGTTFTSGNSDTNPADPIGLLGAPLEGAPLGTFTFNLIAVPEPSGGAMALIGLLFGIGGRIGVGRRRMRASYYETCRQ